MVGKPNFPEDVEARRDLAGSSAPTPGLNALDQEREASLADEGGQSGAHIESQDLGELRRIASDLPVAHLQTEEPGRRGLSPGAVVATAVAAGVVGAVLYHRLR
jgi:hypothetical protein